MDDIKKKTDGELEEIMRNGIDNSYISGSSYNKAKLELEFRKLAPMKEKSSASKLSLYQKLTLVLVVAGLLLTVIGWYVTKDKPNTQYNHTGSGDVVAGDKVITTNVTNVSKSDVADRHLSEEDKKCIVDKLVKLDAKVVSLQQRAKYILVSNETGAGMFAEEPSNEMKAFTREIAEFLRDTGYVVDPYLAIGNSYHAEQVSFEGMTIQAGDQTGRVEVVIGEKNGKANCSI